jgi:hypothetical protein
MQLTISHQPNYHSCFVDVDLNHSVRQKLRRGEILTTDTAIRILDEVQEESRAKASRMTRIITMICLVAGPCFAMIAALMSVHPLTVLMIFVLPMGLGVVMEKMKVFPFSLLQAYQEQASEAEYGHIIKLRDKITYNITSDIVLL